MFCLSNNTGERRKFEASMYSVISLLLASTRPDSFQGSFICAIFTRKPRNQTLTQPEPWMTGNSLDAVDIWRDTNTCNVTCTSVVICISLSRERATVRILIHPISLHTPYNITRCSEAQQIMQLSTHLHFVTRDVVKTQAAELRGVKASDLHVYWLSSREVQ
jgi:hypothetical protein